MSTPTNDFSHRVAALANRLRLVQIDFADEGPDVRREQLCEEIERATRSMVPQERDAFLNELQDRFPSWDSNVNVAPRVEAAPGRSAMDERELKDPSFLVKRLLDLAPSLTEEQKQTFGGRLREAGFAVAGGGGAGDWPAAAAQAVAAELQVPATATLDPTRTLETLTMLVGVAKSLDQLAWNTWRTVSPKSTIRRSAELHRTVARFATGDQDVSRTQVKQDIERLRQLIAALISAVGRAGGQFAQKQLARLSPAEIESAVGKGGFLASPDAKCWQRYKEIAAAMDASAIERELLDSIANFAESLMKGLGR